MENYKKVHQWTATITVDEALKEITALKVKYPWLRCDQTIATLEKMSRGLPEIVKILKLQEKQNAIHRKYIELNRLTDTALIEAIVQKYKIDLDGSAA